MFRYSSICIATLSHITNTPVTTHQTHNRLLTDWSVSKKTNKYTIKHIRDCLLNGLHWVQCCQFNQNIIGKLIFFFLGELIRICEMFQGHTDELWGLATHPCQHQFLTGGADKQLYLWDAQSRTVVWNKEMNVGRLFSRLSCSTCLYWWILGHIFTHEESPGRPLNGRSLEREGRFSEMCPCRLVWDKEQGCIHADLCGDKEQGCIHTDLCGDKEQGCNHLLSSLLFVQS